MSDSVGSNDSGVHSSLAESDKRKYGLIERTTIDKGDYQTRKEKRINLFNPPFSSTRLTAPMLVQTSLCWTSGGMSNPICRSFWHSELVDSLLVLLQNLKGMPELRNICKACTAPGKGVDSACNVPERSIRRALMGGDDIAGFNAGTPSDICCATRFR